MHYRATGSYVLSKPAKGWKFWGIWKSREEAIRWATRRSMPYGMISSCVKLLQTPSDPLQKKLQLILRSPDRKLRMEGVPHVMVVENENKKELISVMGTFFFSQEHGKRLFQKTPCPESGKGVFLKGPYVLLDSALHDLGLEQALILPPQDVDMFSDWQLGYPCR